MPQALSILGPDPRMAQTTRIQSLIRCAGLWLGGLCLTMPAQAQIPQLNQVRQQMDAALQQEGFSEDPTLLLAYMEEDWEQLEEILQERSKAEPKQESHWILLFWVQHFLASKAGGESAGKDDKAALETVTRALQQLQDNAKPCLQFIKRTLLQMPDSLRYQQLAHLTLVPMLSDNKDNLDLWLTHFRVLLSCGKNREAQLLATDLVQRLDQDEEAIRLFMAALLRSPKPKVFKPQLQALLAKTSAKTLQGHATLLIQHLAVREILGDQKVAQQIGLRILRDMEEEDSSLNNFTWGLLTDPGHKGKYKELALQAAEMMQNLQRQLQDFELDTVALAKFENGLFAEAVSLQEKALAKDGRQDPDYLGRLKMYKEALAEQKAKAK